MMKKFLIILAAIVIVLGGTLMYLNHMNYWPFQDQKEAGIPDGEIKNLNEPVKADELSLLLAASGKVTYNVKAINVAVYFDVYQRDKRVMHELVTESGSDEEIQLSGNLVWGIPGFDVFNPTEIRATITNGGAISQDAFTVPKDVFGKLENQVAQTQPFDDGKIKKGERYILQAWGMGKGEMGINDKTFAKEGLKNREQSVILYVVFK
ncbi:hypothetical protein [Listeria sp. SHR_NRA_18]|uniref:hypothetical protein n=1 Tax=Listeria sp. SHR_NRA_18 TaxID=2269046 RepID=UPI000B33939C|nr:hypothetical protein [Listeria sp. SHR_NRA_18]